ncbi:sugar phosphate isomerase/epimerase [Streptomyces sp. NPDC047985]|uniref:sugar phosphate isomerase/epimerase family protein n=1 Tax=Streptomyces sp. NPDC047985 TaxID=3155384 RepID=UPI00344095E3
MAPPSRAPAPSRIRIGSAPDSWGVWFPDDPRQVPWQRFLDEVSEAGYEWIELGPYGYLPTDPARLTDETGRRGLRVSAGTVFTGLHHGPGVWDRTWAHVADVAALTRAMGAGHLVVIPAFWRDDRTGEVLEDRELTAEQWRDLATQTERLAREVRDRYGLRVVVHPHADTHIDGAENVGRFLDATDPDLVSLCLDTGHYAYCGGDSVELIETYGERIGYLHLKQVDPAVLARVVADEVPFGPAVARGVMCEPPGGVPALEPVLAAARALDVDLFAIVEQDMYPCPPDKPFPIARRTREYLRSCGGPRRPDAPTDPRGNGLPADPRGNDVPTGPHRAG